MKHCAHMLPKDLQPLGYWPPEVDLRCCQCGMTKQRVERAVRPQAHGPYLPHMEYATYPGENPFKDDCSSETKRTAQENPAGETKQTTQEPAARVPARKRRTVSGGAGDVSGQDTEYLLRLRDRPSPSDLSQPRGELRPR